MHDHLDDEDLEALAALMPTPAELSRLREWPLGTDAEVDALRMERLAQILGQQNGVLKRGNGAVKALVMAWSDAQPKWPSPVARPGAPANVGAALREAVASDPAFFEAARKKMEQT